MQQRMRTLPDKPAKKQDNKNRNGESRVLRHVKAAATAAAMMMVVVASTPMVVPMRAAGRGLGSQVKDLW
jgi:hypothetical protein